ncbi:YdbL family protein [Shumkonia mesophila]|uniref:YdbL family protein n=1 Tax=Shumkonia mesophila TaxID=2838854 RepID=UPI0029341E0F|nr:YdbL family protein [Shumkonia mesophila]
MAGAARLVLGALFSAWVLVFAVPHAGAASLDEYRAQGIIAERYDGLVEVRANQASPDAERLVKEVNAKRLEIYRQRAQSQGVPAEEVGKIYAQEVAGKAPAGTYFRKPDGSYLRK